MRKLIPLAALAAATALSAAAAAPMPSTKADALAAGDWRAAAKLGASAAEVVRALQAQGQALDATPEDAVVTISADNHVDVVEIRPLPPLPADVAKTAGPSTSLSGAGFAFAARPDAIVLYPADADSFASQAPELPR